MSWNNIKARGKTFLNESVYEGGSITWGVEGTVSPIDTWVSVVEGDLQINDCNNSISLDLECKEVNHIPKRIAKLDVLIDEITKCKETLEKVYEYRTRRQVY